MAEYVCDSCGYRTPRKSAFTKHQNRKTPCDKAVSSNPDVSDELLPTNPEPVPTRIEEIAETAGIDIVTSSSKCPDPEAYVSHLFRDRSCSKRKARIPTHKRFAGGQRKPGGGGFANRSAKQNGKYRRKTKKCFNISMAKRASTRQQY
nr:hypothetical protein TetV2_00050 [Oceanusvirus sp.]